MKDNRLQVVGAIFIKDGKVFAAKRGKSKYDYLSHKYEFAGGKVEPDESDEAAVVRELREEMALPIEVVSPYMTVTYDYPDFGIRLSAYLCRMCDDYKLLEHESAEWLSAEQLHADEWAPADRPILERLKEELPKL